MPALLARNPMAGTSPAVYTMGLNSHFQGGMTGQSDGSGERANSAPVAPVATPPSGAGLSYEGVQREEGAAQPGQMGKFMDQMSGGDDSTSWVASEE